MCHRQTPKLHFRWGFSAHRHSILDAVVFSVSDKTSVEEMRKRYVLAILHAERHVQHG